MSATDCQLADHSVTDPVIPVTITNLHRTRGGSTALPGFRSCRRGGGNEAGVACLVVGVLHGYAPLLRDISALQSLCCRSPHISKDQDKS